MWRGMCSDSHPGPEWDGPHPRFGEVIWVTNKPENHSRMQRAGIGSVVLLVGVVLALLVMLPATALGQTTNGNGTPTPVPTVQGTPNATTTPSSAPSLSLSASSGQVGANITANGSGFQPNETVDVTFNGQDVGSPTATGQGTWSLAFSVPSFAAGQYGVLAKGRASGDSASASFTINQGGTTLTFDPAQAAPGAQLTVNGTGFRAGEMVTLTFNGAEVGTATANTGGDVTWTFTVPASLSPGQFGVTATGDSSGTVVNATYTLIANGATPAPTVVPTAMPTPAPGGNAPEIVHDDRYFPQTGFRIDNDDIWNFFNQYGAIQTFGFPTSRMFTFLGCPVQMFQRQILQVCPGQGVALMNVLDPEIFPYTNVNGSTFPGADATLKNNTPQVGSPTYAVDILNFINQTAPDTFGGQNVNFLQHFNATGGLVIWGAPISQPAPDPTNPNFVYQRFQRGIMHFIAGTGTESILLADYLKGIIMAENVPPDLQAQSAESRFWDQYCPGNPQWLCRPQALPATDFTFAFVQG